MYGTPPCIPGLVQTNITNSAEEKWALLDKDIEMEDSETENENGNGRTILHHIISLHWRASEASETLSGLFTRESYIYYYGTCKFCSYNP